jgi:hypothetical protein
MAESIAKTIRELASKQGTVSPQEVHSHLQSERQGDGPAYMSVSREFSICKDLGLIENVDSEADGAGHHRYYELAAPPGDSRWTHPAGELYDTA